MLRVLQINAGSENCGGVSAILLNLYRHIDRTRVQFDFLTPNKTTYAMYREEIEGMGGHIYELGIDSSKLPGKAKLYVALREFFRTHRYDIIHINSGVLLFNSVVASACHRFTRAKLFVHAHANGGRSASKEELSEPLKKFLVARTDVSLACSASAAEYIFTKKEAKERTVILKNGIDARQFAFQSKVREEKRRELGLSENFVVGCVGRFSREKNQEFLIEVLSCMRKLQIACIDGNMANNGAGLKEVPPPNPDACREAKLLFVGGGSTEDEVRAKAREMGLLDNVIFAGPQADVAPYYMTMDAYCQPSTHEGFGICCLEAEASGLSVVTSDRVPEDADIAGVMQRLPLEGGPEAFAYALLTAPKREREEAWKKVGEAGFDIVTSAKQLLELYEEAARR